MLVALIGRREWLECSLHTACVSTSRCETPMVVQDVGHRTAKEEAMGIKASEVGEWLRKSAGKRDHHELMPEDYVVVRPGPDFDWLMGNVAADRPIPSLPDQDPAGEDRREADNGTACG